MNAPNDGEGLTPGQQVLQTLPLGSGPRTWQMLSTETHKVSRGRYLTSNDPRGYIPVFEYPIGDQWIMLDAEDGYVLWTAIWKALGNAKADVVRMLDNMPELTPHIRRVRGGYLKIQGTWMKYEIALDFARRVAYNIRHDLVPLFGAGFPDECLTPDQAGYGNILPGGRRRKQKASQGSAPRKVAHPRMPLPGEYGGPAYDGYAPHPAHGTIQYPDAPPNNAYTSHERGVAYGGHERAYEHPHPGGPSPYPPGPGPSAPLPHFTQAPMYQHHQHPGHLAPHPAYGGHYPGPPPPPPGPGGYYEHPHGPPHPSPYPPHHYYGPPPSIPGSSAGGGPPGPGPGESYHPYSTSSYGAYYAAGGVPMYSGPPSGSDGVGPSRGGAIQSARRYAPYTYGPPMTSGPRGSGSASGSASANTYGAPPPISAQGDMSAGEESDGKDKSGSQTSAPFYGALGPTPAPGDEGDIPQEVQQPSYRLAPVTPAAEDEAQEDSADIDDHEGLDSDNNNHTHNLNHNHINHNLTVPPPIHDKESRSKSPAERPASVASGSGRRTPSGIGRASATAAGKNKKKSGTTHPTSSARGGGKDDDDEDEDDDEEEEDDEVGEEVEDGEEDPDDPDYTGD